MPIVSQTSFLYDMSKAAFHKERDMLCKLALVLRDDHGDRIGNVPAR